MSVPYGDTEVPVLSVRSGIGIYHIVVVLTLTHNTMQSVVAGQAPITLEWKKYLGKKI